jgi:hypothetical protein
MRVLPLDPAAHVNVITSSEKNFAAGSHYRHGALGAAWRISDADRLTLSVKLFSCNAFYMHLIIVGKNATVFEQAYALG